MGLESGCGAGELLWGRRAAVGLESGCGDGEMLWGWRAAVGQESCYGAVLEVHTGPQTFRGFTASLCFRCGFPSGVEMVEMVPIEPSGAP